MYNAILWEAMRLYDQQEIPFVFVPVRAFRTEQEQLKAFEGDHYDRARFTLTWLFEQLSKRQLIQEQTVFALAQRLQTLLPEAVTTRFECIKKNNSFMYPPFPIVLDAFTLDTKAMARQADRKRQKIAEANRPKFQTVKVPKDEVRDPYELQELYRRGRA
jgi:hypothetical protein